MDCVHVNVKINAVAPPDKPKGGVFGVLAGVPPILRPQNRRYYSRLRITWSGLKVAGFRPTGFDRIMLQEPRCHMAGIPQWLKSP